jgi:hypothetical protein
MWDIAALYGKSDAMTGVETKQSPYDHARALGKGLPNELGNLGIVGIAPMSLPVVLVVISDERLGVA